MLDRRPDVAVVKNNLVVNSQPYLRQNRSENNPPNDGFATGPVNSRCVQVVSRPLVLFDGLFFPRSLRQSQAGRPVLSPFPGRFLGDGLADGGGIIWRGWVHLEPSPHRGLSNGQ
jgi:hypothetical protein